MRDTHPLPGTDHIVDGVRLHVVHHGVAGSSVTPVLLLHGVPTSSYLWRDVQRDLGRRHVTYAPDLVGCGRSERPSDRHYDLATQAGLQLRLLDALGIERAVVVGHDIGGGVALHLAAHAPDRVAALALIDSPVHADAWPVPLVDALRLPVLGELQGLLLRLAGDAGRRFIRSQLARGLRSSVPSDAVVEHYANPLLNRDGVRGLLALLRALDPAGVEGALRLVATEPPPTLALWADQDAWFSPAYGHRVADAIPDAQFICVSDAGHFLPEDRPERVAEELDAFLADVLV